MHLVKFVERFQSCIQIPCDHIDIIILSKQELMPQTRAQQKRANLLTPPVTPERKPHIALPSSLERNSNKDVYSNARKSLSPIWILFCSIYSFIGVLIWAKITFNFSSGKRINMFLILFYRNQSQLPHL